MTRPTWITVVGIFVIVFSALGIISAGQQMLMPWMMKMQQQMFQSMSKQMTREMEQHERERREEAEREGRPLADAAPPGPSPEAIFGFMDEMWQMPPWFGAYSIAYGIIRIVVLAVYLLSGIFLLQLRPSSLNLFYASAAMTILLSIIHTAVVISSLSFIMAAMGIWGLFGVVIDAVLITVVVTSDKTSIHSQRHDSG